MTQNVMTEKEISEFLKNVSDEKIIFEGIEKNISETLKAAAQQTSLLEQRIIKLNKELEAITKAKLEMDGKVNTCVELLVNSEKEKRSIETNGSV